MTTLVYATRVKQTTSTTGTGTVNLDGAPPSGFQGLVDGIGTTNQCYYLIFDPATGDWEAGIGTVTDAAPDTLSRVAEESSNGGALVSFVAGVKDVFVINSASSRSAQHIDADLNANVVLTTGVFTLLDDWVVAESDGDAFTVSSDRITINRPGYVVYGGSVRIASGASGISRRVQVRLRNSSDVDQQSTFNSSNPTGTVALLDIGGVGAVAEQSDYIDMRAEHDHGSNLNAEADIQTRFWAFWFAP